MADLRVLDLNKKMYCKHHRSGNGKIHCCLLHVKFKLIGSFRSNFHPLLECIAKIALRYTLLSLIATFLFIFFFFLSAHERYATHSFSCSLQALSTTVSAEEPDFLWRIPIFWIFFPLRGFFFSITKRDFQNHSHKPW